MQFISKNPLLKEIIDKNTHKQKQPNNETNKSILTLWNLLPETTLTKTLFDEFILSSTVVPADLVQVPYILTVEEN